MLEGRYRFWFFLAFCLVLLGIWQVEGKALPAVVLLSPQEDVYFFPFLEIFLRRVLPEYEVVTLSLEGVFPPREGYIVIGFSEALKRLRLPEEEVRGILLGESSEVSFPLLGQIIFSWRDTALALCRNLCANKKINFFFIGEQAHPLSIFLAELCGNGRFDKGVFTEDVICIDRISRARSFLEEKKGSSFLVVLEAATEALFALQEGKIDGVVDTKPSQVAQCIAEIVQGKRNTCTIVPLFVTQGNISCADAYEVMRRCLSCH